MPVSDYLKGSKRKARRNVRQPCVAHTLAGVCIYFPLTYPKQGGSRERPCAHWHSRFLTVADSDDPYQPSADAHQRNHGEPWGATGDTCPGICQAQARNAEQRSLRRRLAGADVVPDTAPDTDSRTVARDARYQIHGVLLRGDKPGVMTTPEAARRGRMP